ncbi:MAG: transporter [Alphaproteobacteria bacterium]|nr:transporter [Alphaproteobacteria bacterium]
MKFDPIRRLGAAAILCLLSIDAAAREPGIASVYPPGQTLGTAIAVPLRPGAYVTSRTAYYNAAVVNNDGHPTGRQYDIESESLALTWVPEGHVLGGATYKASISVPFAYATQHRSAPLPAAMQGTVSAFGMGNPKVQLVDLAWPLGDGFYAATGFGIYAPLGRYGVTDPVDIGANFWTFEPSLGFTYLKDGWNASLHALYNTNTENPANRYLSGDQLFVNATITKNIAGFDFGPVSSYQKQVSGDYNAGGRTTYGGLTAQPTEQFAMGGSIGHRMDNVYLQLMYTHDISAHNAMRGDKVWLNLTYKFF